MTTFAEFSATNRSRVERWHPDFKGARNDWTGADWANAMQGEAGEAGNIVKKLRRIETGIRQAEQGDERDQSYYDKLIDALADEIGDVYAYLDLLAQFYGIDTGEAIARKFNAISVREGFPERIEVAR